MVKSLRLALIVLTAALLCIGCVILNHPSPPPPLLAQAHPELTNFRQAAEYSEANDGLAMLVSRQGKVIFESYPAGVNAEQAHPLASGTKSFSCAIAVVAAQDGWLSWDEPVSKTIPEWNSDPAKANITIRQLLSLTSGLSGGRIGQVPTAAQAIAAPVLAKPGRRFQYGPLPFQVFAEVTRRKLVNAGLGGDPLDYLEQKVFQPIGLQVSSWRRAEDGLPNFASGASLTAREWAKFGTLIANQGEWQGKTILQSQLLNPCFQGSPANPAYGLGFWLNADGLMPAGRPFQQIKTAPANLVMAVGAGNQALYIFPSQKLVIVRQGKLNLRTFAMGGRFEHHQFLRLALGE